MARHLTEYDEVPDARDALEVDPHWQQLQVPGLLPTAYLPTTMSGPQPRWRKAAAWVVITMLTTVTAGGICLTYGPAELFRLLDLR